MSLIGQQPRYQQLAQAILNDIRDGKYKIGDLLPTEHELCTRFGASRFTVRQALKQMTGLGMITRQPGVGTRLISTEAARIYRQGLETVTDILQYAEDTELRVLSTEDLVLTSGSLTDLLLATPGQEWLLASALRTEAGVGTTPICYTEIYLPPAFRSLRGLEGRVGQAVYRLIEEQFGERTVEVRQEIRAGTLPAEVASLLAAKSKSPCLWITRHYLNGRGQVLEVTRSYHPGDRFQYQQVFRHTV